ncbi:hypothetical protein [Nocardioides jejuensis]|uniref:hypothetical protein n=1 Tax=Nocardioides jejuensis TaxID=2502782 RepID=UPI0014047F61|nr:hypothetical protein [Nocardioides jejuensis]
MCRPVPCKQCGKTTWTGCGQHVADVKAVVPAANWCAGHAAPAATTGWLSRLTRR